MKRLLLALALIAWPGTVYAQFPSQDVTLPTFIIPASAVNGGGGVSASLIPTADNTYDLGSSTFRWKDLWLGGSLNWSSTSLSQGAANRLDLASGDSFNIVSGGLGVGTAETNAGRITATGVIGTGSSGQFYYSSSTVMSAPANGKLAWTTNNGTSGSLIHQFTDNPTCATNCGTSPTLSGVDSSFTLTMGASGVPASGFIVTFNSTWAAAPQCTGSMGKTGMAVGKLPLTIVTDTSTMTVVTNGTAPATTDVYHFRCSLGQ